MKKARFFKTRKMMRALFLRGWNLIEPSFWDEKNCLGVEIAGWQGWYLGSEKAIWVKKGCLGVKKVVWGQNGVNKVQIRSFWAKIGIKPAFDQKKFPYVVTFGPQILTPENVKDDCEPRFWKRERWCQPRFWKCERWCEPCLWKGERWLQAMDR